MAPETPFERYLAEVAAQLQPLDPERRVALLDELQAHLADTAIAAGADSSAPSFQRAVIERLGPARRVGRELLAANETPDDRRSRRVLLIGAVSALLIPFLMLAILANAPAFEEGQTELAVVAAQMVLLPVVLALWLLCRPTAAWWSGAVALVGVLGVAALPINSVIALFVRPPLDASILLAFSLWNTAWLSFNGVWAMLVGGLLLQRNRLCYPGQPWRDPLLGPALLGMLWGVAWLTVATNTSDRLRWAHAGLLNVAMPSWLVLQLLWCLWISLAFVQLARTGLRAVPAAR